MSGQNISINQRIAAVQRCLDHELSTRTGLRREMRPSEHEYFISCMKAAIKSLRWIQDNQAAIAAISANAAADAELAAKRTEGGAS